MWFIYVGVPAMALVAGYSIWKVRAEYESQGVLSTSTSVAVWVLYLLHLALTVYAAWRGLWPLPIGKPPALIVGSGLAILGVAGALAGMLRFRSLQRVSGRQANKLVTSGIYRWSRNPQNVGWGLALLGIALMGRSALAFALAAAFALLVHVYTVYVEEPYLERVYGQAYRDYRASTPRYLGLPKIDREENL